MPSASLTLTTAGKSMYIKRVDGPNSNQYYWIGERDDQATGKQQRGFGIFDFSGIANVSSVSNVTIKWYADEDKSSNTRTWRLYQCLRAWVQGEADWEEYSSGNNWATAGAFGTGDYDTTELGSVSKPATGLGYINFGSLGSDIEGLIKDWINGVQTNNGFVFKVDTELNDSFRLQGSSGANYPTLTFDYVEAAILKELTETIIVTDTLLKEPGRVLSEVVAVVDTIVRAPERILSETITLVDTVLKQAGKVLSDALTLSDTFTGDKTGEKVLAETVTVTDVLINQVNKTFSETITLVDTAIKNAQRSLTETIIVVDTIIKSQAKVILETITVVDTFIKNIMYARVLSEIITIVDTITTVFEKVLSETITLVDTTVKELNGAEVIVSIWIRASKAAAVTWTRASKAASIIWTRKGRP